MAIIRQGIGTDKIAKRDAVDFQAADEGFLGALVNQSISIEEILPMPLKTL
jgi:hypothetical protein